MFRNFVSFVEYFRENIEISSFVVGFVFCMIFDCVNSLCCFFIEKALDVSHNRKIKKKEEKDIDKNIDK